MKKDLKAHLKVITENAVDVISEKELASKLKSSIEKNTPLRVKVGFDPTARDIHLGHTVLLNKLRKIQDLGHEIYFLVGDFTAAIGDPSGRSQLRPPLSKEQIIDNAKTYTDQAFKILDKNKTKIIFNSHWFNEMKTAEFVSLMSHYTVARVLERDDFSKRMKENKPLSMQEIIYPLIQGYDSVHVKADIEFGGTDQKFNLIVGRHLQESFGQQPQVVITMPLLVGLDGTNKMSKSLGNYVGVTDELKDMFGKIMSISDDLMWDYYRLLTDEDVESLKKIHPKEVKMKLATIITAIYHDQDKAVKAKKEFETVFSNKELPSDMPELKVDKNELSIAEIVDILVDKKIASSKREARRLFEQKSISIDSKPVVEGSVLIENGQIVLKIGKRRFLRIISD